MDMAAVTDSRERWGRGRPPGGRYWTRERTEVALRAFIASTSGELPSGSGLYLAIKHGRPELPTWVPIHDHLLSPECPTLSHLWLALGAPRRRVRVLGGRWTEAELEYLLMYAGRQTLKAIAARLHRSYAACRRKLFDHGTTARNAQGYMSACQVAIEYGCAEARVRTLIKKGILPARLVHTNRYEIDPYDAEAVRGELQAPPRFGPTAHRFRKAEVITRVRPRGEGIAA